MRKTKIICTLGPSSEDYATIRALCVAGMNVARINMSHGNYEEHKQKIDIVKQVRKELNLPIAIMLDTKGPEIRIKTFKEGGVELKEDQTFTLTTREVEGDEHVVSVNYKGIVNDVSEKDNILINNGLIILRVKEKTPTDLVCTVISGGKLTNRKSMNIPGVEISLPYLSEVDKQDLLFGIANDVDFVAASFVSRAEDVVQVRKFLEKNGGENIDIVSKIENYAGVRNISAITEASDGIMIARGDMGVEVPFEKLPAIQKQLIKDARLAGRRVITATEMLESMIEKPRPTRAEASDVANAVFDETSTVMLSGETAAGRYPVEAVKAMSKICVEAERNIHYGRRFKRSEFEIRTVADAISHSTVNTAIDLSAKAIIVFSKSGSTGRMVSRFRPETPIIVAATDEKAYRKLAMSWGVIPVLVKEFTDTEDLFRTGVELAKEKGLVKFGDVVVITAGLPIGVSGNTNMIKVEQIE